MKYIKTLALFFLFIVPNTFAQNASLRFKQNGKFKIIQITDTHFILDDPRSDVVSQLLNEIITSEQPDFIMFTGDMVWKNKENTKEALNALFEPVIKNKIPWAYVFGNHDDEADMSRLDIMNHVAKMPYCLATRGNQDLSGIGNYILEIKNRNSEKTESLLYCFDSHAYTKEEHRSASYYAWMEYDQIDWYKKQSKAYTDHNAGQLLPSLAFFHIPLCEYPEMTTLNDSTFIGTKGEKESNGKLNTGMFSAMRLAGDIMGIFVGHDHDNDYIGNWKDIYLAFGRYSGGKTVYNNLGENGCRIIELTEGKKEFDTYIYLLGGETFYNVHYPSIFNTDKK